MTSATGHIAALRRDLEMAPEEYLTLRDAEWCSEALPSGGIRIVVRELLDVRVIVRQLEDLLEILE